MRALRSILGLETEGREGHGRADDARDTETVARIVAELEQLDPDEARFLAAFAYVLARVARADLDISEAETQEMIERVREFSDLPPAQATLVVLIAKSHATTLGGTENYVVTRQFRELSSRAQRIDLLRCLFAVAAADENISSVENAEIGQIGTELGFTGEEVAGLRSAYRDQLAVMKEV
jgi:uncharacterized tellurite resistance protein B-like protein